MTHDDQRQPAGLPAGWTAGRDLVVLIGRPPAPILSSFERTGRERLFLFSTDAEEAELTATVVRSRAELFESILALPGTVPVHVTVRRFDDAAATAQLHHQVAETVREALRSKRVQALTVAKTGTTWLLQGLENLPEIARVPSIAGLNGACRGEPAVIVSPGPSLSKNIDQLAALKGRALLVAGTHVLSALDAAGVVPDLIVAADSGDLRRHYEGLDLSDVEAMIVGATCRREVFQARAKRTFSFASNGPIDDWIYDALDEEAGLSTGGSVACSQLSLALHLGCDPIAFVGQDLSFTDRFYAKEGLDGDAMVEHSNGAFLLKKPAGAQGIGIRQADGTLRFTRRRAVVRVAGYYGGTVPTTPHLATFLAWFEAVAERLAGTPRLLNCTEGGARIRGTEQLPLAELAEARAGKTFDVATALEHALEGFDHARRKGRLLGAIEGVERAVKRSRELALRCAQLAARAAGNARELEQLGRLERELGASLKPARLCALVAQDEIVAAQEKARLATTLGENLDAARTLFGVVEQAGALLERPLSAALDELRAA